MFETLSQFYNSNEWRNFRKQVISQRTNKADGVLYDEHNGKPLLKAYDIVLHHIKPLTMQNVNDYSVSLNPENILIVSQQSHNEIHSRFGYVAERKVYFVYGAPCSGKTTFVNNTKGNSDLILDMDNIWECLTGKRYEKPNALKTNAFTIRDCIMDMIKTRAGKWERAFVISGSAVKSERERLISVLGAEPIFIQETKETCLKRLATDKNRTEEQKREWTVYIDRWFDDYTE